MHVVCYVIYKKIIKYRQSHEKQGQNLNTNKLDGNEMKIHIDYFLNLGNLAK